MTEYHYDPYKKVIVKEIIEYTPEQFRQTFISQNTILLRWCDGVLFQFNSMMESEKLMNAKAFEGVNYWAYVAFCKVPKYSKTEQRTDSMISAAVNDETSNPIFADFIKWLKNDSGLWREPK